MLINFQMKGAKSSRTQTQSFVLQKMFLAGLSEDILIKTMDAHKPTKGETLAYDREMEVILNDKKKPSYVNPVQMEDQARI